MQMHSANEPVDAKEITAEERESRLWSASKQYMLGEINEKQLEDVEHHFASKEITRTRLVTIIMAVFTIWILFGLIVFVVTGNVWLLTTTGILALPLERIYRYYFKSHE